MAETSDQDILDAVRAAILEIVNGRGSSWSIAGRQFTALDLDKLRAMEKDYRGRIARRKAGRFRLGSFGGG